MNIHVIFFFFLLKEIELKKQDFLDDRLNTAKLLQYSIYLSYSFHSSLILLIILKKKNNLIDKFFYVFQDGY